MKLKQHRKFKLLQENRNKTENVEKNKRSVIN